MQSQLSLTVPMHSLGKSAGYYAHLFQQDFRGRCARVRFVKVLLVYHKLSVSLFQLAGTGMLLWKLC